MCESTTDAWGLINQERLLVFNSWAQFLASLHHQAIYPLAIRSLCAQLSSHQRYTINHTSQFPLINFIITIIELSLPLFLVQMTPQMSQPNPNSKLGSLLTIGSLLALGLLFMTTFFTSIILLYVNLQNLILICEGFSFISHHQFVIVSSTCPLIDLILVNCNHYFDHSNYIIARFFQLFLDILITCSF